MAANDPSGEALADWGKLVLRGSLGALILLHGIAIGAHRLELLGVFRARVGIHLLAFSAEFVDLSIPSLDLRFHGRDVIVFHAHGMSPHV